MIIIPPHNLVDIPIVNRGCPLISSFEPLNLGSQLFNPSSFQNRVCTFVSFKSLGLCQY